MDEKDIQKLKEIVLKELSACGYFLGDYNIHNIPIQEGWKPYSSKSFGEMLLDFAMLYNMEFENKNYRYINNDDEFEYKLLRKDKDALPVNVVENFERGLEKAYKRYQDSGQEKVDSFEDNHSELSFAKGFLSGCMFANGEKEDNI